MERQRQQACSTFHGVWSLIDGKTKAASLQYISWCVLVAEHSAAEPAGLGQPMYDVSIMDDKTKAANLQYLVMTWAGRRAFSCRAPSCARYSSWMTDEGGKSGLHCLGVLLQGNPIMYSVFVMDSKTKAASLQYIVLVCGCCRAFSS